MLDVEALPMEEDDLPETMSPISLPDALDTTGISDDHQIKAESAPVKIHVKAGQKRKHKDSNANQLPRSDLMIICFMLLVQMVSNQQASVAFSQAKHKSCLNILYSLHPNMIDIHCRRQRNAGKQKAT